MNSDHTQFDGKGFFLDFSQKKIGGANTDLEENQYGSFP